MPYLNVFIMHMRALICWTESFLHHLRSLEMGCLVVFFSFVFCFFLFYVSLLSRTE